MTKIHLNFVKKYILQFFIHVQRKYKQRKMK